MDFKSKKIVITGGSIGIGKQLAVDLKARGAEVLICARNEDKLAEIAALHPDIHTVVCDVRKDADVEALHKAALEKLGSVDVLFNNAALFRQLDLMSDTSAAQDWMDEIDVNVNGTLRVTHAFLPDLRKAPQATIVNFTSGLAYAPVADAPVYSASKAALASWTQSLRFQLRKTNVSVIEVSPPVVDTRMNQNNPSSEGRKKWSTADFCKVVLDQFAKDPTRDILVGDGKAAKTMARIAPGFTFRMMNPAEGRSKA